MSMQMRMKNISQSRTKHAVRRQEQVLKKRNSNPADASMLVSPRPGRDSTSPSSSPELQLKLEIEPLTFSSPVSPTSSLVFKPSPKPSRNRQGKGFRLGLPGRSPGTKKVKALPHSRKLWQTAFGGVVRDATKATGNGATATQTELRVASQTSEKFELDAMFKRFDRRREGEIEADDIGCAFHNVGIFVSAEDLRDIFDELDEDVSGSISFKEFTDSVAPIRSKLNHMRISERALHESLTALFTNHGQYKVTVKQAEGTSDGLAGLAETVFSLASRKSRKKDKSDSEKVVEIQDAALVRDVVIDMQDLPRVFQAVGHMLTLDEQKAAQNFVMDRLSEEDKLKRSTYEDDVGTCVAIEDVVTILLKELKMLSSDGGGYGLSEAARDQLRRREFCNLLPAMGDKRNFGLEVWRTLLRRFFVLDEMHNKCKDMIMLFGQRRMDKEMERIDKIDRVRKGRHCFFFPDSDFRFRWDLMQVVLLVSTAFFTPLRAGFSVDIALFSAWFWFELFSDCYFWVDIMVSFRSAYYDQRGGLVIDRTIIARNYVMTWFLIDVASCLPIQYIEYAIMDDIPTQAELDAGFVVVTNDDTAGKNRNVKLLKVMRLFRLAKMLRLVRLKRLMTRYEEYLTGIMQSVIILKMLLVLLFVMHLLACGWFSIGTIDEDKGFHEKINNQDGFHRSNQHKLGWVTELGYTDRVSLLTKYLRALFHCITDFAVEIAQTDYEMLYVCLSHVVYEGFFAYLTGTFASAIITGRLSESRRAEKMGEIREFLLKNKIPIDLRQSVTTYYEHYFNRKSVFNESALLKDFPPRLRNSVVDVMYREVMQNMPFFRGLSDEVSFRLCMALKPVMMLKNDVVFMQGNPGYELYMIHFGQCLVYTKHARHLAHVSKAGGGEFSPRALAKQSPPPMKTRKRHSLCCDCRHSDDANTLQITHNDGDAHPEYGSSLGTLSTGSFFGELAVIEADYVHDRTVLAAVDTELGYIEKAHIDLLANEKPELMITLHEFSKKRRKHEKRRKTAILKQISMLTDEISANVRTAPYAVWIGHLSDASLDEDVIRKEMRKFGQVESVFLRQKGQNKDGLPASWGFVVYHKKHFAAEAVSCSALTLGIKIGTDQVLVFPADPTKLKDTPVVKIRRDDLALLDNIKKLSSRIDHEGMQILKDSATLVHFQEDAYICQEKKPAKSLFVVLHGSASMKERGEDDAYLQRGALCGESGLSEKGIKYAETVVASTDVQCLCIQRATYLRVFNEHTSPTYANGVPSPKLGGGSPRGSIGHMSGPVEDDLDQEGANDGYSSDDSTISNVDGLQSLQRAADLWKGGGALGRRTSLTRRASSVAVGGQAINAAMLTEMKAMRQMIEAQGKQIRLLVQANKLPPKVAHALHPKVSRQSSTGSSFSTTRGA